MVAQLTSGVSRRLGPGGNRWWQIATHWGAYLHYLESLEAQLGGVTLPGLGDVELGESFVPLRLRPWPEDDRDLDAMSATSTRLVSLEQALEKHANIQLVGPAGTGKSALLKWHAIEASRAVRGGGRLGLLADGGPPSLPIYVPLADDPVADSLETRAIDAMTRMGFECADEFLKAHLGAGRAVLLFDDLDTLPAPERREAAGRIEELVGRYPGNRVVVATRDVSDREWLPGFQVMDVVGVDPGRVESLAGSWGYEHLANASGFLQVVERSPLVRSLVARPGWLAAGLAAADGTEETIGAFDVVEGFVRHLEPGANGAWAEVALGLHTRGTTVGLVSDLPPERRSSGLLQWLSEDQFRFVHLAVQAYFAAAALAKEPERLAELASDEWWQPVAVLAVGHLADPSRLINELLARDRTVLAGLALAEARRPPESLRETVEVELLGSMGRRSGDGDRLAAIALAGLLGVESVRRTGVVAPVLQELTRESPAVRRASAAALGRLGDPSAIPALLTALGDPDEPVRETASDSLAEFGERTVQPLVRQLNVPNEVVRQAAIVALARQGNRAVPALIPLLDSSSATGRAEAAEALAQIGSPAVPALLAVLRGAPAESTSDSTLQGVAGALTKIGRPAVPALVSVFADASPATRLHIIRILSNMGHDAVESLGEMVESSSHPHSATAAGLIGDLPDAGPAAAGCLVAGLSDGRFEVRAESRRSLRRLGPGVLDELVGTLRSDDPHIRWEAASILLALPEPPVEQLTDVLTEMLNASDVAVRRRAVRALGTLTGNEVRTALEAATGDQDPVVRRSAITLLGSMGDPAAATTLESRWKEETDEESALLILEALVALSEEAAIPTLIDALAADGDDVRLTASELLAEIGEPVVGPLVVALNQRPAELDLQGALHVLERAGASARASGRAPANLARTYYRMLVEPLEVEELVYLATTIEWWPPAYELHRTFATAKHALEYRTLGGIGAAESELEWVDTIDEWLRPMAQRALRQLRLISQAVQYYNRGATRRTKEKGLLAAADRLNTLRTMIGELGEPHIRVFHAVAEHWNTLINDAIRELQGRADLDLEIRTDHVRIRDVDTAVVLVFEIVNSGEGLASNVQLSLSVDEEALNLLSAPTYYIPPLGQGDRISAEFTVRREGAGVVPITLDVKYDDPQKEGQTRRFQREVRFFVEDAEYRDIGTSPYIAGPPVKTPEMFYGRHATFTWVQENLSGTYQDNVLVLHGERRTGKTSVLYQLQYHLPDTYAFVLIDLQSIAYGLGDTSDLLYAMARKAVNGLRKQGFDLERPVRQDFAEHPIEQFESLGEAIGELATETGRRAVLIVDEFDLLIEAVESGNVSPFVFDCIRGLMQHQDGLSFIFAGAHKISAMLKNPQSILFNTALSYRVTYLDREDAEQLIREPVADVLWYDDLAVEKILRVTAGQPYFIQYICHEIVNLARRDRRNFVTLRDVDRALQETVQETTGIIRHAYMSLTDDQPIALTALAHITDDGRPFASLDDIAETLHQDGLDVAKRDLFESLRQLVERDFLVERGGEGAARQYGFAMDLVRVWIEQNDEYQRLLEELRA
ncbi:MAG: HEAT repeat domain-containing protein [Anaerolineae bacterium]